MFTCTNFYPKHCSKFHRTHVEETISVCRLRYPDAAESIYQRNENTRAPHPSGQLKYILRALAEKRKLYWLRRILNFNSILWQVRIRRHLCTYWCEKDARNNNNEQWAYACIRAPLEIYIIFCNHFSFCSFLHFLPLPRIHSVCHNGCGCAEAKIIWIIIIMCDVPIYTFGEFEGMQERERGRRRGDSSRSANWPHVAISTARIRIIIITQELLADSCIFARRCFPVRFSIKFNFADSLVFVGLIEYVLMCICARFAVRYRWGGSATDNNNYARKLLNVRCPSRLCLPFFRSFHSYFVWFFVVVCSRCYSICLAVHRW